MRQESLSKEEAGELLDQRFQVLVSTQQLRKSTRNFVKITGDYLGEERPICLSLGTCIRHIDRFDRQYDNSFAKDTLFRAYLMDRIHKRVRVFLHSCDTNSIEYVELGDLADFGVLKKKVERGEWLMLTPRWVDRTEPK